MKVFVKAVLIITVIAICTNEDDAKDCLRSFASSYSGNWSYPRNSCHTFQLKSMTECCLSR